MPFSALALRPDDQELGVNRRDTALVILALAAAPLASDAQQQGKIWRIGFLGPRRRPASLEGDFLSEFPRGMRELGYVEGKNLVIEWRFADGQSARLPALAEELVRMNVDLLLATTSQAIKALQNATRTIPIVMANAGDPVASGFVASLARPGGNITGLANLLSEIIPKLLDLLLGMVPAISRVAYLVNPVNPALVTGGNNLNSAAQSFGVSVFRVEARTAQEIDSAFPQMLRDRVDAVIVPGDALFFEHFRRIAELSIKNRMSSVSSLRQYAEVGGLASYGPDPAEQLRRAATYVDKIFKGAKPGDLPIEQSANFELLVNGTTARALGLTIPQSVLLRAAKVI